MTTEQPSLGTGIRVLAARGAGGWRDGSGAVDLMLAARGAEGWRDGRATAALRSDKLSGRGCGGRGTGGSAGGRITRGFLPRPLKIKAIHLQSYIYMYIYLSYISYSTGGRLHHCMGYYGTCSCENVRRREGRFPVRPLLRLPHSTSVLRREKAEVARVPGRSPRVAQEAGETEVAQLI